MSKKIVTSFLIVNYKSLQCIEHCLEALHSAVEGDHYEVVIANNDENPIEINQKNLLQEIVGGQSVTIVNMAHNTGFAVASNAASRVAQGQYLFFLNPDTGTFKINLAQMSDVLNKKTRNGSHIGIVAPLIKAENGQLQQYSFGTDVTPWSIITHNIQKLLRISRKGNDIISLRERSIKEKHGLQVDWVTGAAFMMKKSLFKEIGGFDELLFLYFEDIDLCKRLRSCSYAIVIDPNYSIVHTSGQSSSSIKIQKKYYFTSQDYYIKKHYGQIAHKAIILLRKTVRVG